MTAGPLAGVRVLDLSRLYPGAFCTQLLADLGAEVVKVEAPGSGDPIRQTAAPGTFNAAHVALNRGKRSLALDLRSPAAGDVLGRLVAETDVVVESHRPGQLEKLGLGYEAWEATNPRLVWCSITGFGTTGPNAQAPGHDLTYLGYAGLLASLAEGPATPPALTVAVPMAASMAAVGILAALHDAGRTGKGRRVDANMVDSAMWPLGEDLTRAANAPAPGWPPFAARSVFRCADGREVTVTASEPRSWAALCEALDVPDLAGHQLGVDEEAAIARLTEVFRTRPAADWLANPGLAGGVGPVLTATDLLDDPQVVEHRSLVPLEGSGTRVLANPVRFDGELGHEASHGRTDPPELGAHTDDVLAAAGFTTDEIAGLRAEGVIA